MRKIVAVIALLLVACTNPYSSVDNPHQGTTSLDRNVISWIDKRLVEEYYWLDEVEQVKDYFNRDTGWKYYLPNALAMLTTNGDDGDVNEKGQRTYYSFIRELPASTRAEEVNGYGVHLYNVVVTMQSGDYGLLVNYVDLESPADRAGVRRGDIIISVNGSAIGSGNYVDVYNSIVNNKYAKMQLTLRRQVTYGNESESYVVALEKGVYDESPILFYDVLDVEGLDQRIGYIVYSNFDREYDGDMLYALRSLDEKGFDHLVLDLRINSGGAVESAVTMVSAILGVEYNDRLLCELRRNPRNRRTNESTRCYLKDVGVDLGLREVTVICSEHTASASELVIEGLRGLDIPVHLVGTTTEGKNCGMDLARRQISGKMFEYAPITFMCFNGKGFGDFGNGIAPDAGMDVKQENVLGKVDKYYPMPHTAWGDTNNDIALRVIVAAMGGTTPEDSQTRSTEVIRDLMVDGSRVEDDSFVGMTYCID